MKKRKQKIDFNDRTQCTVIWNSLVVKYMISEMEDIFEECQVVNALRKKHITIDEYGQLYMRYVSQRLEYNSTLTDEEQLRDLVTLYVLMTMNADNNFGSYTDTVRTKTKEVEELGIFYLRLMYLRGKIKLISIPEPESCIIPKYMEQNNQDQKVNGKTIQPVDVYFSQRIVEIGKQFADFIRQSVDEVKGMKEVSKTPNDFGLAIKTYTEGRLSYIKYLRDTARLYNLACLTQILSMYKRAEFGRYADEIFRLYNKIAKLGSEILVMQAKDAGITLIDKAPSFMK